ncbi:MAG: hypothetical protein M1132_10690, partial [Chloroflexi bacterium]|nr:hypothetical protein [Chloroflexota bacterium]
MPLYEFVLEIQHSDLSCEHREWVLAAHDELAMRHARDVALHWRPQAQYDQENDVYTAPEGFPQWTIARCTPVALYTVPMAGKKRVAQLAPILWDEAFPQALHLALQILRALADPSLAGCSLAWVLSDHLEVSTRSLGEVVRAISDLEQSLPESVPVPKVAKI